MFVGEGMLRTAGLGFERCATWGAAGCVCWFCVLGQQAVIGCPFFVFFGRGVLKTTFEFQMPPKDPQHGLFGVSIPDARAKNDELLQDKGIERNLVGKLKWLLHCTMGCQDTTFNTRKREIAILKGRASDADVLSSYISSVDSNSQDPWMLEFIGLGHLAAEAGGDRSFYLLENPALGPSHQPQVNHTLVLFAH